MAFNSVATVSLTAGRRQTEGCWTGYVADMHLIRSIKNKSMPDTYMENYPRHKATALNSWLSRFGILTNGMFLELDQRGTSLVKDLIKRSPSPRGFRVRVDGIRKGDKIQVTSVREIEAALYTDPDFQRIASQQLRGEFGRMGI